jgi:hypothetical protein
MKLEKSYHNNLYPLEIINVAVSAYSRIAEISLEQCGDYTLCRFSRCVVSSALVVNEFDNYLIELMNSNRRYDYT